MNEGAVWVWKRCSFDAAHQLHGYPGGCARVHGHTYFVELGLKAFINPKDGIAIDLRELGDFLKVNVIALFDHQNINDKMYGKPSTAENIANCILELAVRVFKTWAKVRVFETPDSWVEVEHVYPIPILKEKE